MTKHTRFYRYLLSMINLSTLTLLSSVSLAKTPTINTPQKNTPTANTPKTNKVPETSNTNTKKILLANRIIAVVNQTPITEIELNQAIKRAEKQLNDQKIQLPPTQVLKKQVIERLIVDRVLAQEAQELGILVDENAIDNTIQKIAQDNKLSIKELQKQLEKDGVSFPSFRQALKEDYIAAKLKEKEVDAKIEISEAEIDEALAAQTGLNTAQLKENEYRVAQIVLNIPENASDKILTEQRKKAEKILQELKQGANFSTLAASYSEASEALQGGDLGWRSLEKMPTLFVPAVKKMQLNDVSEIIRSPAGFHILKLTETRSLASAQANIPEVKQTKARHILIRINETISEEEAKQKIRDIKQKLAQGADFAALAKRYSMDGTANKGGDLGWIFAGQTVPEFEQAMDNLPVKQVSDAVITPFGLHLIEVLERKTDKMPVTRQREVIRQMIGERKAAIKYQEWVQHIRDKAYVEYRDNEE